ncbi:FecR family protein [Methylotenera sp.]|uniref:FecR family protein n=1 Tax=Methylotenera sp. TaxID=2051956 RepID=UPI002732DF67|nr:FecR family protein [Methylotenera sp.]MDP3210667.1 FecR family protein [Methylotenera sp.]
MTKDQYIYLNHKTMLAAMISAAFPMSVNAAAGKVEFAYGGAAVQSADGGSKILAKGMDINSGDTILTGRGRAQVKFTDGGYMSFQPDTQFKVEDYNFNGKQDGSEKGFFRLIEGGLRAVTGLVGRENRPNYRVATPVATIGIRGSYFLAEFREKLKTHVGQGSIFIFNDQGDIILFQGQTAEVETGKPPKYSDEELTLGARGPEGGEPEDGNRQQLAENDSNNIFKLPEQYDQDGVSTSLGGGMSAVIANLNGINAEGVYALDTSVTQTNSSGLSELSYVSLIANFGNYQMNGDITVKTDSACSAYDYFYVSGTILPSGSFGLSGSGTGDMCYSSCDINVVGLFSGAQAEKAGIGYSVTGDLVTSGTAGIIADPPPATPPI